jgi:predicted metalloprotease with PDZ domain
MPRIFPNTMHKKILFLLPAILPFASLGQNSAPMAVPIDNTIPAARDVAWPGQVILSVDATDVTRGIFKVTETVAVSAAGDLVLLYPKWLPGNHSPGGQIANLAGLKISADGHPLTWQRDRVDVYGFHIGIPAGISNIQAQFEYVSPTDETQGRIVTTPQMLNLEWDAVVLYPAGVYVRDISVAANLKLPEQWKAATALEVASEEGPMIHYKPMPLDVLVDSPLMAGANVRIETLAPGVRLDIVADEPEELAATEQELQLHRDLVTQAVKLFGAQHYNHYDFLLALSDRMGGIGLEHHRSSEDGPGAGYFTEWTNSITRRQLLPHEYTHSWNGKYRRPADLWTPDYRTPMQDDLLWVYEGQTQFWGVVLGARSGLLSKEQTLGSLASIAARLDTDAGREWRSVSDTTDDPIISQRRPKGWRSWQRSEDYYNEGLLIWLDADSLIRELSHGQRSMDDFARAFFGVNDRDWGELTYTFDDVVRTLNQVQAYDWATFLNDRLQNIHDRAPLDGFARGGYQLVYTDTPTEWFKSNEKLRKVTDLTYSAGFVLGKEGEVTEVAWDGPAFNAGLTVGSKIIAVNNHALDTDRLKTAIKAKKSPLNLLVKTGDIYRTIELNYDGGLRYPHFEKTNSAASSLDALLAPKP